MSPRAAWRLDALGFEHVFDYAPGKADWAAAGLPIEGRAAGVPTAGSAADPDVPTCTLDDDLRQVRERVRRTSWDQCIVVNDERVVLGRLGRKALAADDERTVEDAMTEGPGTVRPDTPLDELLARLERRQLETALVTTSDGRLVGVVRRQTQ
jgi:Mg/Co/Ni transporter MgtE